jgi:hypothetical protein
VCPPSASVAVLNVAVPVEFNLTVARTVLPSRNVTVPLGVPEPGAAVFTVAVNVTDCPSTDELAELATVVLVVAGATVCVTCRRWPRSSALPDRTP